MSRSSAPDVGGGATERGAWRVCDGDGASRAPVYAPPSSVCESRWEGAAEEGGTGVIARCVTVAGHTWRAARAFAGGGSAAAMSRSWASAAGCGRMHATRTGRRCEMIAGGWPCAWCAWASAWATRRATKRARGEAMCDTQAAYGGSALCGLRSSRLRVNADESLLRLGLPRARVCATGHMRVHPAIRSLVSLAALCVSLTSRALSRSPCVHVSFDSLCQCHSDRTTC